MTFTPDMARSFEHREGFSAECDAPFSADVTAPAVTLVGSALSSLHEPALLIGPDGSVHYANRAALDCYGYSLAHMLTLGMGDLEDEHAADRAEGVARCGEVVETLHRRHNGERFWAEVRWIPATSGLFEGSLLLVRDIGARKAAEGALRTGDERFRTIGESINDVVWVIDPLTLRFLYVSPSLHKLSGFTSTEAMAAPVEASMTEESARNIRSLILKRTEDFLTGAEPPERAYTREIEHPCKDGSTVWTEVTATFHLNEETGRPEMYGVARNITERKRAEEYKELGRDILQILNEPGSLHDAVQRVLSALKARTGLDAIGIRLKDGDDFPYFAQDGFSPDFLRTEDSLVERKPDGTVCRNSDGSIRLECTCGLVISGAVEPTSGATTAGGSYWTNDSMALLGLSAADDPRHNPRNQCIHHGYASVALVPIRAADKIVGLVHLNDRRTGCFTDEIIELLESIAAHIGSALMRKQAEEHLLRYQARLREFAAELVASGENEHRRLGGELHEGVGQVLAAAKMAAQLLTAEPLETPAMEQAQTLVELLGESISQVRLLTSDLTPTVLFELGLGASLLWLRDRYRQLHGLTVTIRCDAESEGLRGDLATFVFRVVRDTLDNVVRHSGAPRATVAVRRIGGCVSVSVTDRGRGFDPAVVDDPREVAKFGLFSIREECLSMGGDMVITSRQGRGTRISVRVPDTADTPAS